MACTTWTEHLTERLYGEIAPADDAALAAHLASCAACREELAELTRVRACLREDEPALPRVPRVMVLRERSGVRPALMAATLAGAAILAGTGAGLGYAWGRGHAAPQTAAAASPGPAASTAASEEAVRREVDRRFAAWEASQANAAKPLPASAGAGANATAANDAAVTSATLAAEFAKFERRLNGARASDLDYMLEQIAASEYRVGSRIGKTNDALRTVALASNPYVAEQ